MKGDKFSFQKAFVLHRQGKNEEAHKELLKVKDKSSVEYGHLLSQITYKLKDYDQSISIYLNLIKEGRLPEEELSDISTNLLANGANAPERLVEIDQVLTSLGPQLEKTYEYVFNEGLVQISNSQYNQGLQSLLQSYDLAIQEEDGGPLSQADLVRFKV